MNYNANEIEVLPGEIVYDNITDFPITQKWI